MNTLKTLAVVATATLVMAGKRDPAGVTGGADGDFAKKEAVVDALKTCFEEQKASQVALAAAKTACKSDAGVSTAFDAWGSNKAAAKETEIDILLRNNPNLRDAIETDFAVDASGTASAIEDLIGVDADASTEEKAAVVKDYRQKEGANSWADTVKTCKATGSKDAAAKKACATGTTELAALCTETADSLKCCTAGTDGASNCGAKDALRILEDAAADKLSEATQACSRGLSADVAACKTDAETAFQETTGIDLTTAAGKVLRQEKLADAAKGAVGDAVKGCMGSIAAGLDEAAAKAYRQGCVGGDDAIQAMADALGKASGDITKTDAAKFAKDGAKTAGLDKMKTFTGTKLEKLDAAKTDMAAAAGKISSAACDNKETYTPECMTKVDAKKAIAAGAQDCMADAVAACVADTPDADCGLSGTNRASIIAAVLECNGEASMSDEQFGRMQEKAKAGKVAGAYKAATASCAATGKAACVKTAASDACKAVKGTACGDEELILGRNKGAAKDMAETIAACMDSGEVKAACDTAKETAYTAATGKTFTATGAAKLQKKGARGAVAELMGACYDLAADAVAKRKCNDPTELPEIKQAYAAALGKPAADITGTEFKAAVVKGAKSDAGVAVGGCLGQIDAATTGAQRKTAVKACHTASITLARAGLGKPEATDMSDMQVKDFLQESAKGLEKDKFEACFETAAEIVDAVAQKTAKDNCRGTGAGAATKRTEFKETCGKPDWSDTRAEKEMYDNTLAAVADDFENCMDTNAPKTGTGNTLAVPTDAVMKTAFATCKTAANIKRAELTGEVADPIKAQKDCVRNGKKKVAETVGACKAAGGVGVATCGDPANNPDLLNKLKLTTGKIDMSHTEARKYVKESGNKAAGDFMKTCMEDSDGATLAECLVDGKKAMGDATGEVIDNKKLMVGLLETAKDEVADAFGACVKSGKTRGSAECKAAKVEAFKATGLGDLVTGTAGEKTKKINRMIAKVLKKGAQKSMANAKQACIDLAADNAAKVLCNTNEIRDAKIAKAEAEGKDVADIKDADVAKDLEKGKEAATSEAMEACTEKATGTAEEKKTKTRKCVTDVETLVAATEGKTKGSRRLAAMDLNKIKKRMNEAGVASFGKKMNACMDAADLETGAAVGIAKDACKTAETDMFTKATGKIAGDIKEGDVARAREDAAVKAFMETNIATANAVVDGETYTDDQKNAAVKEALKKVEGDKSTTEFDKTKLVSLKKKAGAKAIGDKAVACVMATATDALAKAACDDANLMGEAKLATGKTNGRRRLGVTEADVIKKDKRKAAKDLLKAKLKACGKFTVDADDVKVATFLQRKDQMANDKKQAMFEIISEKMMFSTGGVRDAATGVVTPPADSVTEAEKTLAKRDKMKVELKLIADAEDGNGGRRLAAVTDEELDAALDAGAADLLDTYDDCATADKAACKSEIEADLKKALGCETKAIQVKKNQIAKLVAAQYGADIKAADDAKTTAEKAAAPVRDEAAVEALMKTKFLAVGGVKGTFDACKAEIKKAKDAYVENKDIVIKKKESLDIVIAYPKTGDCLAADDDAIKAALVAADDTMNIEKVGVPTKDGDKCKTTFIATKKTGTATSLEWKGAIAKKYTDITTTDRRRLNGRRLPSGMDSSADQSTEIDSQDQPGTTKEPTTKEPTTKEPDAKDDDSPSTSTGTDTTPSAEESYILSTGHTINLTFMVSAVTALVAAIML